MNGSDALIISIGTMLSEAIKAAKILKKKGISCAVFDARFLKPLDKDSILSIAENVKVVATVEDNTEHGGLFGMVSEIMDRRVMGFTYPDKPIHHASVKELREEFGLDGESIAKRIANSLQN